MLPRIATIESSLHSFQYKLLNNILYLNERLFKFDVMKSPLCSLCILVNETVVHLFCECKETKDMETSSCMDKWMHRTPKDKPRKYATLYLARMES